MADQTKTFSGQLATAATLNDLNTRIKQVFANANTTNAVQYEKINFSDLVKIYNSAQTAITALSGINNNTLNDFSSQQISGIHGLGIVEKTVGDLENLCFTHKSTNVLSNSTNRSGYTSAKNSTNFANNESAANSGHRSNFTSSSNSSNFSGNSGTCVNNYPFAYMDFCPNLPYCTQNKATVLSSINKSFWENGFCEGNRSSFTPSQNSSNFSGNTANSTNRSNFTAGSNSSNFSIFSKSTNFSNNAYQCKVVHNIFSVEGVDF